MAKREPKDLSDEKCHAWSDVTDLFGDPLDSQHHEIEDNNGKVRKPIFEAFPKMRSRQTGPLNFDDPEFMDLLTEPNLDPKEFMRKTRFKDEASAHMATHIQQSNDSADDVNKSTTQKIADNLHHFIFATEELTSANSAFMQNNYPAQNELERIKNKIIDIQKDVDQFYKGIDEQEQKSNTASDELKKIGSNAFLFTMSTNIERDRSTGQFDEIVRFYEKKQRLPPTLKVQYPFSLALQNIEKAFKSVKDSLINKILQMTPKTFNDKYCTLLMGIQPNPNPIFEIMTILTNRIKDTFSDTTVSLNKKCTFFENTFPFIKTLADFHHDHYLEKYNELLPMIDQNITSLSNFISDIVIDILTKESKTHIVTVFNKRLHKDISRVSLMWVTGIKFKFIDHALRVSQKRLQEWYLDYLKHLFTSILRSPQLGGNIVDYLSEVLEGSSLFSSDQYVTLITGPIYELIDQLHEQLIMNDRATEEELVSAIEILIYIKTNSLNQLFNKYQSCVKQALDPQEREYIILVTNELTEMLKQRLLNLISQEMHHKLFASTFLACKDWSSDKIEVGVDGWLVYFFNRIITCKCKWGTLYPIMREDIIAIITSSILYILAEVPDISKQTIRRLTLNLAILEETLYMKKLKPEIDPNDPSGLRTIDPKFGILGKHPELCYVPIEQKLGITQKDIQQMRTTPEYASAKLQLAMQIRAVQ